MGKIEAIEKKSLGDFEQSFYVMRILDTNMLIMIPTEKSTNVGLRGLISEKEVKKVFDILSEKDIAIETQPWNQRYREYMEKIKTGSIYEIASVLRDLHILSGDKNLSFGERKMMDTAKNLVVKEIALANSMNENMVQENIDQIFS